MSQFESDANASVYTAANREGGTVVTAVERFEQAFGQAYRRSHYYAIKVRKGAVIYFNDGEGNRDIASASGVSV